MHSLLLGVCLVFITGLSGAVQADVFEGAEWLRDPRMDGHPIADYYGREAAPPPKVVTPANLHTLFRGFLPLFSKPDRAVLHITADDYFKCYINGYYVAQGPEPTYPFAHAYLTLDVTALLEAGPNVLAAQCYYQGRRNRVWNSGDNRSGFIAVLELAFADGKTQRYATTEHWRCLPLDASITERTFGYETQFAEDMDLSRIPRGWQFANFDDRGWQAPFVDMQDHRFVPSDIPPLQRYRLDPVLKKKRDDGTLFFDFGKEIVGHTAFRTKGNANQEVRIRHAEELLEPDVARYKMRASKCDYEESLFLTGNEDKYEFYDYRGFRYVEALNAPEDFELWAEVRHYPLPAEPAVFNSGNTLVQQIWDICQNGVVMGSQGGFLDCPTREKGQYLGDALIASRAHRWITGDARLTGKAVKDFALSRIAHAGLMAVAPGNFMQEIAEYSLQYPLLVQDYYQHSGDATLSTTVVQEVFPGIFDYFATFENESGLLVGMNKPEKWLLVDWPASLRDGYEYSLSERDGNTVLNAFYYGALTTAAALSGELGLDGAAYTTRADRVRLAIQSQLIDATTGLYIDAPGSSHSSLHANAVPLFFGLTDGVNLEAVWKMVGEKGLNCGVYMAAFLIEACFKNGAADLAWRLINAEDEHSWQEMIRSGATACMEVWGPDQKGNTSWCHPWSSSPVYLITEYVLGIQPGAPGWTSIRIAPARIRNLPPMQVDLPIPGGRVQVNYAPGKGYTVLAPKEIEVLAQAPEGERMSVNGEALQSTAAAPASIDTDLLAARGWEQRVGTGLGVWVDAATQRFIVLQGKEVLWQAACATAENGTGQEEGSLQTPLGWHTVDTKLGEGAPWGQVFRSRAAAKEVWKPGDDTKEDLVLTRVLWLSGLEAGVNQGKNAEGKVVDSKQRHIYIHGTNGEDRIGTPSSHGCIRLYNDDVIKAFDMLPVGTPVLITNGAGN
ncbi:MAG: family 78 glycoside hydrolase catalytic domain [Candidatus Hydrogenedentes bacterium]|nr:family 78 glycoside hydrolase catalytic domain [Candidatus Hydrogenedentota bacterium]